MNTTGSSIAFLLTLTPPNNTTPNNTSWSIQASMTGANISPVVSETRTSTATASLLFQLVKTTNGNVTGTVARIGDTVTFRIAAYCDIRGTTFGDLYLDEFRLVDVLPPTVTYVSSNPPGQYDPVARTVTWNASVPPAATHPLNSPFPAQCQAPDPGAGITVNATNFYTITARINDGTELPAVPVVPSPSGLISNTVGATYSAIDSAASDTKNATSSLTAYVDPPPVGNIISKTATAPYPGLPNYTYPGNWNASPPSSGNNSSEANYVITTSMANLPLGYQPEVYDPMPCLSNYDSTIGRFSSLPMANLAASPYGNLCTSPAFHPEAFTVRPRAIAGYPAYGYAAAYANGWRPIAVLTDGSQVPVDSSNPAGAGVDMDFPIPASLVGRVAMIVYPRHPAIAPFPELSTLGVQYQSWIFGYADAQVESRLLPNAGGFNRLTVLNRAYLRSFWRDETTARYQAVHETANFAVQRPVKQIGILKSFTGGSATVSPIGLHDPTGANGGPYTGLSLNASVLSVEPIDSEIVITDLLPQGMTVPDFYRTNPADPASAFQPTIRVRINRGTGSVLVHSLEVPWTVIDNHLGTGRQLIRIVIPPNRPGSPSPGPTFPLGIGEFSVLTDLATRPPGTPGPTSGGVTPLYLHTQVQAGSYENTGRIFAPELDNLSTTCRHLTNTVNVYSPTDPLNESGYGPATAHCQHTISVARPGTGAGAFDIDKQVRGNLDAVYRNFGDPGNVSLTGGSARYRVRWTNTGGTPLQNVVFYDVLPGLGDLRTASNVPRNSAFPVVFAGMVTPLPSGVTVEYSGSANACRADVYPAQPAGCVNDWVSNPAAVAGGPAGVKALKVTSSQVYNAGSAFAVEFNVTIAGVSRGQMAYNNAAAVAAYSSGDRMLPVDGRPVGLRGTDDSQLTIGKVVDRARAARGDTLTYTVTVHNAGPLPAIGVAVSDALPADLVFASASDGGVHDGAAAGGQIGWVIDVAANSSRTLTVTGTAADTAALNTALINSVGLTNPPAGFQPPLVENACAADATRACAATVIEQLVEVSGRVYVESATSPNTQDDGAAIDPGVAVHTVTLTCTAPEIGPLTTLTDSSGHFSFAAVPAQASCSLVAVPPAGHQARYTQTGQTGDPASQGPLDTGVAGSVDALTIALTVPTTGSTGNLFALAMQTDMTSATTCLPASPTYGGVVQCTVTCTNVGSAVADQAFCSVPNAGSLPGSPVPICGAPTQLAPGGSLTCTVSFTVPVGSEGIPVTGGTGAANDRDGGVDPSAGNNPSGATVNAGPSAVMPVPGLDLKGLLILLGVLVWAVSWQRKPLQRRIGS
ncbi:DUF11 domain-containing protein [Comamonas serinivorans]|uniref:DUF11 domain-containing protein n=1 Tax=Comamonas serinivorans TaxID=1082851 RepID=UPI00146E3FDC|nr:DUF11 domain-containing protein [Comamonas serinivorans]